MKLTIPPLQQVCSNSRFPQRRSSKPKPRTQHQQFPPSKPRPRQLRSSKARLQHRQLSCQAHDTEKMSWKRDLHWSHRRAIDSAPDREMLEQLGAALPTCGNLRVLDICAGSGRGAAEVLKTYHTARVELLDSSRVCLDLARGLLDQLQTWPATLPRFTESQLRVSDPFTDDSVDVIVAAGAFDPLVEQATGV